MTDIKTQKPLPPAWINEELIEAALNNENSGAKIRVEKVVIEDNDKGLGYSSNILRIVATARREEATSSEQVRLVVKYSQERGRLREIADENSVFRREALLLGELLPRVRRLLQETGGGAGPLAARCLLAGERPAEFLLLEDLAADGFRLPLPGRPLDSRHCSVALHAYARLHAGSARLLRDRPELRTRPELRSKMADVEKVFFKAMLDKVCKTIARELRTIPGYERYADKYDRLADKNIDQMASFWNSGEVTFPVLLHVDSWKNNFMFKYDGEDVTDVRILDFQMSRVHSPAADVLSFLYVNASEEVHREQLASLLLEYHAALQRCLRALGLADAYPLDQFHAELDRAHVLAIFNSAVRGMVLTSEEHAADFARFFDDTGEASDVLTKAYRHPDCISYLKYVVPIFDEKGLL